MFICDVFCLNIYLCPSDCALWLDLSSRWDIQQISRIFTSTRICSFEVQCEGLCGRTLWVSAESAATWQPGGVFGSALAHSGAPPPDWWSCLFLITSEIKYHASNNESGSKDSAAAGTGATTRVSTITSDCLIVSQLALFRPFLLGNGWRLACPTVQVSLFARNSIWDGLIVQLCDLLEVRKAEQSVLCGDLSNSADKSALVKLVPVQFVW